MKQHRGEVCQQVTREPDGPQLPEALELADMGLVPAGAYRNRELPAKHHQPRLLPPRRAEVLAVQLMEEAGESCKFEAII